MNSYKLKSSDGEIFEIDKNAVMQMVTIQTMVEDLGESDEVIPVPTVNSFLLKKVIAWMKIINSNNDDDDEFFDIDLKTKLELIIAADYLELSSLVREACFDVIMKSKQEDYEATAQDLDQKVLLLLEEYRRDYGYDVIVAVQVLYRRRILQYYDPKVIIVKLGSLVLSPLRESNLR